MADPEGLDRPAATLLLPERMTAEEPTELSAGLAHLRELLERQDLAGARAWVNRLEEHWPEAERVQHFSRILQRPPVTVQPEPARRPRDQEYRWLRDHASEHPGCWLALLGGDLIAADPDFAVVLAAVQNHPRHNDVLLHFQPGPQP